MSVAASSLSGDSFDKGDVPFEIPAVIERAGPEAFLRAKVFRSLKLVCVVLLVATTIILSTVVGLYSRDEQDNNFNNQVRFK